MIDSKDMIIIYIECIFEDKMTLVQNATQQGQHIYNFKGFDIGNFKLLLYDVILNF